VREPEVEDLHEVLPASARRHQDVVALEVAVDDAEVVRARERGAHLLEDVDAARERHGALRELARERRADEVLHDEVELALFRLADVVDVDDVRVVDAVGRARLAQHPRAEVGLAAQVGANELQRDHPVDEDVTGAIDDAHSAFARPSLQTVATRDHTSEHGVCGLGRALLRRVHAVSSEDVERTRDLTNLARGRDESSPQITGNGRNVQGRVRSLARREAIADSRAAAGGARQNETRPRDVPAASLHDRAKAQNATFTTGRRSSVT
jgi:hypothetical protein